MSPPPVKKVKTENEVCQSLTAQFDENRKKAGENVEKFKFNMKRVKFLTGNEGYLHREAKGVAYYLHRDQRLQDNWAALYAQKLALADNLPLYVIAGISGECFCFYFNFDCRHQTNRNPRLQASYAHFGTIPVGYVHHQLYAPKKILKKRLNQHIGLLS